MQVKVKYRGQLAEAAGSAGEQMEAATVREVLAHIKRQFGADAAKKAKAMVIAVNGESILHFGVFRTALRDGDEIAFLPVCGGG